MKTLLIGLLLCPVLAWADFDVRAGEPGVAAHYREGVEQMAGLDPEEMALQIASDGFDWWDDGMSLVCLLDTLYREEGTVLGAVFRLADLWPRFGEGPSWLLDAFVYLWTMEYHTLQAGTDHGAESIR